MANKKNKRINLLLNLSFEDLAASIAPSILGNGMLLGDSRNENVTSNKQEKEVIERSMESVTLEKQNIFLVLDLPTFYFLPFVVFILKNSLLKYHYPKEHSSSVFACQKNEKFHFHISFFQLLKVIHMF